MATPPINPKSGFGGFMKEMKANAKFAYGGGILGGLIVASDLKGILDADNKFKALLKTLKDFVLVRVAMVGIFNAIQAGIRGLVKDTGSLDQAFKKLGQMQMFTRSLSSFVGGLQAARQRIAALSQLTAKSPFKFEEIAEANKSLEVFTRGAYSSVQATKEVGMAAIATGNNITDVASAVGAFYDNLRAGQPVNQVSEQLRQMGIISQSTADQLVAMADGGTEATTVFGRLTDEMKKTAAGAGDYKSELAGITVEHQKAIEALQEKFASPFTANEVKNIQNTTDALKAITPTVEKVAGSLAIVFGGFTTAKTGMAKFLAESKGGQKTLEVLTYAMEALSLAAVGFGVYAATTLTPIIAGLGQRFVQMGGFAAGATVALRGLAIVGVWALVATAIASVVGAVINYSASIKQLKKDFHDWSTAQAQSTAKLREQAAAITTLADKNALLGESMKQIIALQKERNALDDKRKHRKRDEETPFLETSPRQLFRRITGADEREKAIDDKKDARIAKEIENRKKIMADAAAAETVNKKLVDMEAERAFQIEQQTKGVEQRDKEAMAGLEAQKNAEKPLGELEAKRVKTQQELDEARGQFEERSKEADRLPKVLPKDFKSIAAGVGRSLFTGEGVREAFRPGAGKTRSQLMAEAEAIAAQKNAHYEKFTQKEKELTEIAKQKQAVELAAPEFSAMYLNARAQQLRDAKEANVAQVELNKLKSEKAPDKEALRAAEVRVERARALAGPAAIKEFGETGVTGVRRAETAAALAQKREERPPGPLDTQAVRLQRFAIENQIQGQEARRRGDVKAAQASEDLSKFAGHMEQLTAAGFGKPEAAALAQRQTAEDIKEEYAGARPPVGQMRELGLGGNLPQVDATVEINRRMAGYQQKMVDYLAILAGQDQPGAAPPATFQ